MKTLGEVFNSQFGINLPDSVSNGVMTKLNINNEARLVTFWVKFDGLIERQVLFDSEKCIARELKVNAAVIKPQYSSKLFSTDYFSQLYIAIKRDIPSINGTLNNAEVNFDGTDITINLLNGGKNLLDSKGFDKALVKIIADEFNIHVGVKYTGTFEAEAESLEYKEAIKNAQEQISRAQLEKAAEFYKDEEETSAKVKEKHAEECTSNIEIREGKFATPQIIQSSIRPLYGNSIRGKMIPISAIAGDSGRIVIWGDVFDIEK